MLAFSLDMFQLICCDFKTRSFLPGRLFMWSSSLMPQAVGHLAEKISLSCNIFLLLSPSTLTSFAPASPLSSSSPPNYSTSALRPSRNSTSHPLSSHFRLASPDKNQSHTPPSPRHTSRQSNHADQTAPCTPVPSSSISPLEIMRQRRVQRRNGVWVRRRMKCRGLPTSL